jgi:hypothetical protein
MADHIPSLVEGVKGTLSNPENPATQLNLINASEQFLQVCEWLWNVAKTASYPVLPTCGRNSFGSLPLALLLPDRIHQNNA